MITVISELSSSTFQLDWYVSLTHSALALFLDSSLVPTLSSMNGVGHSHLSLLVLLWFLVRQTQLAVVGKKIFNLSSCGKNLQNWQWQNHPEFELLQCTPQQVTPIIINHPEFELLHWQCTPQQVVGFNFFKTTPMYENSAILRSLTPIYWKRGLIEHSLR